MVVLLGKNHSTLLQKFSPFNYWHVDDGLEGGTFPSKPFTIIIAYLILISSLHCLNNEGLYLVNGELT